MSEASTWVRLPCVLCGEKESPTALSIPHQDAPGGVSTLVRCGSCGLLRLDPHPTPAQLSGYYGAGYNAFVGRVRGRLKQAVWNALRDADSQAPHHGRWLGPFRHLLGPIARSAFDISLIIPRGLGRSPRILDIGCGYGDLLIYFKSRGCVVKGVDLDERAVSEGRRLGLDLVPGTGFELDPAQGTFDRVILCHSLEHVPDPLRLLKHAGRLLAPGGEIHIAVPNGDSADFEQQGILWGHLSHPLHNWFFNASTLAGLVERTGLKVKWVGFSPFWRQRRKLLCRSSPPEKADILRLVAVSAAG